MASSGNFFSKLISSIFGGNDPEAAKKKALKNIAKNFTKTKYHFYHYQSHEVDPSFAKFFFDIYKAVAPAQTSLAEINPNALKRMVVKTYMSEKQIAACDEMSEESINEMARKLPIKEINKKISEDSELLAADFDSATIAKIDNAYTKLVLFISFCSLDYYYMLKKFDTSLRERSFNITPRFNHINGSYVLEDIKNFTAVAWTLPFDSDWDEMFRLVKTMKGIEPIAPSIWKKILVRLRNMRDRRVFEMMVQLISEDPKYRDDVKPEEYHIVDDFINQTREDTDKIMKTLQQKQTAGKVDSLLNQIFGTSSVPHLKNYNEQGSAPFERKTLGAFMYVDPLSYLKQFLLDYTKKEIRELSDILLVRGEWASQQMAKPMSESYHQLLEICDEISNLDDRLAENAELGMKLKTLLPRTDRDREARNIIQTTLGDVNDTAAKLILAASRNFITYDRNLKMCLEDFVKQPHSELIINWKELDHFAEGKVKQMCVDVYKKIFAFVSLMQNFPVEIVNEE